MGSIIALSTLFQLVCLQSLFGDNLFANSINSDAKNTSDCNQPRTDIYGLTRIDCSGMNLTSLSLKKISSRYKKVDFSGNNFQELNKTTFHTEDNNTIVKISDLDLKNSNICAITDDIFNNRINVDGELDLSNNRLTRIPFLGEQELIVLFLQHNPIEVVDAKSLSGLTNLHIFNLSYCEIYMVEPDAFDAFKTLDFLYLHNNRLSILAIPMDKLNRLRRVFINISNNTFLCDCYNYEVTKFIVRREKDLRGSINHRNTGCLLQLNDSFCAPKDVTFTSTKTWRTVMCSTNNNTGNTQISIYQIDDEGNSREMTKDFPAITPDKMRNDSGNSRIGYGYKLEYDDVCSSCRIYCVAENIAGRASSNVLFTNFISKYTSQLYPPFSDRCKSHCINCHLTSVPEINLFYSCPSGQHTIDLSSNNLQYLPKNVFANQIKERNSSVVRKLILRNCHISRIDDGAFHGMSNLKLLDLNGNALTVIPTKSFLPINQLEVLDLSGNNQLEKLDSESFETLKKLKILNLTSCAISQISTGTFIPLKDTLQELRMGDNNFENVSFLGSNISIHEPSSPSNTWKNLSVLDLSRNPLKELQPFAFSNMVNLKYLDLSSCKTFVTISDETFNGLKQLQTLNLSSNKVQEIEIKAFSSLTNILELKLNDNSIKELLVQVFDGLSTNQTCIDLKENVFQCTCHNLKLFRWLKSNPNVANDIIKDCAQEFSKMRCEPRISRMNQIDNRSIECEVKSDTGHAEITWFWDNLSIPATNSFVTSIVKKPKPCEEDTFISTLTFISINSTYKGSKLKCVAQDEVGNKAERIEVVNIIKANQSESFKINFVPSLIV